MAKNSFVAEVTFKSLIHCIESQGGKNANPFKLVREPGAQNWRRGAN